MNLLKFVIVFCLNVMYCNGLQGIPSWISLGLKSPFIEFKSEYEVLSNTSIALNITNEEGLLNSNIRKKYQNDEFIGIRSSNSNASNETLFYLNENFSHPNYNLVKPSSISPTRLPIGQPPTRISVTPLHVATTRKSIYLSPVNDDARHGEEITLLEERIEEEIVELEHNKNQKFIQPLALKNPTEEPKRSPLFQDSSHNIEDLKRHILMLQNLTKNDKNFQSKFVVFPNLQRSELEAQQAAAAGGSSQFLFFKTTKSPSQLNAPIQMALQSPFQSGPARATQVKDAYDPFNEKITIVPQVFLQNDQTPMTETESNRREDSEIRVSYASGRNQRNRNNNRIKNRNRPTPSTTTSTTTTTTTTTTTRKPSPSKPKKVRNLTRMCQRNPGKKICQTHAANMTSIEIDNNSPQLQIRKIRSAGDDTDMLNQKQQNRRLNRPKNRKRNRQNQNYQKDQPHLLVDARDGWPSMHGSNSLLGVIPNETIVMDVSRSNGSAIENININPHLCYGVKGFSRGQQKLCTIHTSIMPAISRGARSAIQECKHQFKNRRWNCSTVDDETVFGPMTSIGSPEMAFVHALAAAGVASFIARACRDGQLASCGCSRSSRPNQLHSDWIWGGCGDDLEFGYKFSQTFIDVRERERKRGTRGLVTVPHNNNSGKLKVDEKLQQASNNDSTTKHDMDQGNQDGNLENSNKFKPEDLIELQEKITKEILNTKLQEKEMHELQEKINREILNSKVFSLENHGTSWDMTGGGGGGGGRRNNKKLNGGGGGGGGGGAGNRLGKGGSGSIKARSLMNLHNNEAGRRAVIKKSRIQCKCHGVSGSCSLITCWQQLTSIREIGDFLREKYDEATQVKLNKRGRLQVKDPRYKVPTPLDLVYLDDSPDWCRNNRQLQWPGTHGRVCNKTSSGLDGCSILCCGRGYNTKKLVVRERCNCKFHWCCQVKCETCVKVIEEYTCK